MNKEKSPVASDFYTIVRGQVENEWINPKLHDMINNSLSNPTPNSIQVKMLKGRLKNIQLPPDIFVANKPTVSLYTVFLFRLIFRDWIGNNKDN